MSPYLESWNDGATMSLLCKDRLPFPGLEHLWTKIIRSGTKIQFQPKILCPIVTTWASLQNGLASFRIFWFKNFRSNVRSPLKHYFIVRRQSLSKIVLASIESELNYLRVAFHSVRLSLLYPLAEVRVDGSLEIFQRLRPVNLLVRPEFGRHWFESRRRRSCVGPLVEAPRVRSVVEVVVVTLGLIVWRKSGQKSSVKFTWRFGWHVPVCSVLLLLLLLRVVLSDFVLTQFNWQAISGLLRGWVNLYFNGLILLQI